MSDLVKFLSNKNVQIKNYFKVKKNPQDLMNSNFDDILTPTMTYEDLDKTLDFQKNILKQASQVYIVIDDGNIDLDETNQSNKN